MKKWIVLLLVAALLCPFAGCGKKDDNTIWVVTEESTWDRMNGQLLAVKATFEEAHPGVTIQIDILPTQEQERSAYLQQLRTQILRGQGPDAYLLPTSNSLMIGDGVGRTYCEVEMLFADVAQAMENGMFRDMSQWYDADTELGKDSLNTAVMNAGVQDGNRYILPLRYDIPVIYAELQALRDAGFDVSALEKTMPELMQAALATGDPLVAAGGVYDGSEVFGNWIDYKTGQVTLTEDTLTSYMETYRRLLETSREGKALHMSVTNYIWGYYQDDNKYPLRYPLYIGSLAQLLDYAPVAQYEESECAIVPLQAQGGGTVATVTYYAAMGSGCRNPEVTYEFLRQFLLEESQWEYNRPTKMNMLVGYPPGKGTQDKTNKTQTAGLIEKGWPVRTKGSLAPLWEVRRKQFYSPYTTGDAERRMRKIGLGTLEERWEDILDAPICEARFPSAADTMLDDALRTLNDPMEFDKPTNVSARTTAQNLLWEMRRHVSEG